MAKLSKNRKEVLAKYDADSIYDINEAIKIVKEITFTKFDASVNIYLYFKFFFIVLNNL